MRPFVINRHGRMVFPSSYFPDVDLSLFATLEQFERAVQRDFEDKAPTGTDIAERVEQDKYPNRFELLRDLALNLFWVNRYALTMYEKRPTRWRDVAKASDELFLPVVTPWVDGEKKVAAVDDAYRRLPPAWDEAVEDRIYAVLFDVFRHKLHHATELPAIKPTVAEIVDQPDALTFRLRSHDPDYPVYSQEDILNHRADVAELESLGRWSMVLHNQYPWDRSVTELAEVSRLEDDDFVVVFAPRNSDVSAFIRRAKAATPAEPVPEITVETVPPVRPFPPLDVRRRFAVLPRIEALSAVPGEHTCSNDDVIRNSAFNWSPMSAEQIATKTGIEGRRYTERPLEHLALDAARAALSGSGRTPEEIGAVLVCTCTNARLIPSMATWISGQLGIYRTYMSCDLVAACAGFPYGLADAVRILQEIERPVLVVFAEKFSDKIGSVRTSRMLFGDGAAAMVVAPAPDGADTDIEYLQTYASGPISEVNSIMWPNAEFDGNVTVFGPEVKALVERYLAQMIDELKELRLPGSEGGLLDHIDAVVPHQANKVMVSDIATEAGIPADKVYFNIDRTGNLSAASIPVAIHDAVVEGVIDRPMRIFCPGFGAGAVAGYAVLRLDPDVVVRGPTEPGTPAGSTATAGTSVEDARLAFS
ncbi:MAG: ketoacyl-ACP synthase III [Actinomycetota bacterium]|nr:ketoacyl-ACP synthase III [Actinomycetota bacterium]